MVPQDPNPVRASERFAIHETRRDDVWIVSVEGEFDLAVNEQASEVLLREDDVDTPLVIDLTPCAFIDSTGLKAVMTAAGQRGRERRPTALVSPSGTDVRRVLDLTNVSTAIPTADTLEDALGAVRSAA